MFVGSDQNGRESQHTAREARRAASATDCQPLNYSLDWTEALTDHQKLKIPPKQHAAAACNNQFPVGIYQSAALDPAPILRETKSGPKSVHAFPA